MAENMYKVGVSLVMSSNHAQILSALRRADFYLMKKGRGGDDPAAVAKPDLHRRGRGIPLPRRDIPPG